MKLSNCITDDIAICIIDMSNFVGTSPFLNSFMGVAMETMHFHIAQTGSFLELYFAFRGS